MSNVVSLNGVFKLSKLLQEDRLNEILDIAPDYIEDITSVVNRFSDNMLLGKPQINKHYSDKTVIKSCNNILDAIMTEEGLI